MTTSVMIQVIFLITTEGSGDVSVFEDLLGLDVRMTELRIMQGPASTAADLDEALPALVAARPGGTGRR